MAPVAEKPGFDEVTLNPLILPALSPVQAWHDCRPGRIEAGWTLDGSRVTYRVTLPQGCAGRLAHSYQRKNVTLDGTVVAVPAGGLPVPAGTHEITFDLTT